MAATTGNAAQASVAAGEARPARRLAGGVAERVPVGAVAGLFAGLVFLLANMGWAVRGDKPAVAPLIDISTIFRVADMPKPTSENVVVGLVTHPTLSLAFGIGFALLVPLLRKPAALVAGGVLYGLALYLINFQVLGRLVFEWFTNPMGPPQGFEVFIHAVYGLLLVPFFAGALRAGSRPRAAPAPR